MKVLIPMLCKAENRREFWERATKGAQSIILMLVIDPSAVNRFGFATSEIAHGNALMEEIKGNLGGKEVDTVLEWGETAKKVENLAKLQRVDKVVLMKQDSIALRKLVKKLQEAKIVVEVV
ncbi:MAG: hypothetical protein V1676_05180 [Candidatus Diapherotrites archaeon]